MWWGHLLQQQLPEVTDTWVRLPTSYPGGPPFALQQGPGSRFASNLRHINGDPFQRSNRPDSHRQTVEYIGS